MAQILALLTALPQLLSVIHSIVLLVEQAFPKASGAAKLDAAVTAVGQIVPQVSAVASQPALGALISTVVTLLNRPDGVFGQAKAANAAASAAQPATPATPV